MSSPVPPPSRWRAVFRGRRKWLLIPLVLLLALGLFAPVENWRGRRAWEKTAADLTAQGETFALETFKAPAVPDGENRMKHPFALRHLTPDGQRLSMSHPTLPGLSGAPYELSELRLLSLESVTNRSLREQVLALGLKTSAGLATQAIAFSNTSLTDSLKSLLRIADVNAVIDNPDKLLKDAWGRPIKLSVTNTDTTPIDFIDDLLAQNRLVARYDVTNRMFHITPALPSLKDVLGALQPFAAEFTEFDDLLLRPKAVAWLPYDFDRQTPMTHFINLRSLAQCCATHALVSALMGERSEVMRDLHRLRGAADCALDFQPPSLVGAMIHTAIVGLLANTVQELLGEGFLSPAECAQVQRELSGFNLIGPVQASLRAERIQASQWLDKHGDQPTQLLAIINKYAGVRGPSTSGGGNRDGSLIADFRNALFQALGRAPPDRSELLASIAPRGWVDQNRATLVRWQQEPIQCLDPVALRVDARRLDAHWQALGDATKEKPAPYQFMVQVLNFNFNRAFQTAARNQTQADQAGLACALERFRTAQGRYPETLTQLMPDFADHLPHDLFDGQPLRYRPTSDGKYLLYSIGWNTKDDGGAIGSRTPRQPGWRGDDPDWVWGK